MAFVICYPDNQSDTGIQPVVYALHIYQLLDWPQLGITARVFNPSGMLGINNRVVHTDFRMGGGWGVTGLSPPPPHTGQCWTNYNHKTEFIVLSNTGTISRLVVMSSWAEYLYICSRAVVSDFANLPQHVEMSGLALARAAPHKHSQGKPLGGSILRLKGGPIHPLGHSRPTERHGHRSSPWEELSFHYSRSVYTKYIWTSSKKFSYIYILYKNVWFLSVQTLLAWWQRWDLNPALSHTR